MQFQQNDATEKKLETVGFLIKRKSSKFYLEPFLDKDAK